MIKKTLQKIFKKISYSIFIKIYGRIEKVIDSKDDDRIKIKTINEETSLKYNIYSIDQGRLYTDRIQDTAAILDNKIIRQASFQLRHTRESKIFNGEAKDNIVLINGTPRKLKNLKGSVLSLLTGGGGNNNYWHWLFDVLPRIGLFCKTASINEIDYFLLPDNEKKFQVETLDRLNIPNEKRLSSKNYRHIQAEKLIIVDHPVVTTGNATNDIMNMPSWISHWLKKNFITKNVKKTHNKKIYIDRNINKSKSNQQRQISNEEEVKQCLKKKGFIFFKLHEMDFIDQVELFNNAEYIIGLHGGGFANLAFCRPNTKVIELKSSDAGVPIENLAKKNNLNYNSISVKAHPIEKFNFPNQQGSIHIPLKNLTDIIENI